MGSAQGADEVVAPHLLQCAMGHQPAVAVRADPAAAVQGQSTLGDQQVQVGMPLQVAAEGVQHRHDAQTHAMLLPRPLSQRRDSGAEQQVQGRRPAEIEHTPQMSRDCQNEVMVRHVEQVVEHTCSPAVCGVLATGGTKAGLAGVGDHLDALALWAGVQMAAQSRRTAGEDLAYCLEDYRTDR